MTDHSKGEPVIVKELVIDHRSENDLKEVPLSGGVLITPNFFSVPHI